MINLACSRMPLAHQTEADGLGRGDIGLKDLFALNKTVTIKGSLARVKKRDDISSEPLSTKLYFHPKREHQKKLSRR